MSRVYISLVTILSFAFFSCRSINVIDIETYNPSSITFPKEIKTVMIVNNSAQQPDNVGHSYIDAKEEISYKSISTDSMAYFLCMSLGKALIESPRFDDVRMCDDTIRRDSFFYDVRPISPSEVDSYCRDYGVDALISLDKLFFKTFFFDARDFYNKIITVEITGEIKALWPGQKEMYSIPFNDSLVWNMEGNNFLWSITEVLSESDVKVAMKYSSEYIGNEMYTSFVPYWTNEKRWYYKNFSSEWKRGTVYAAVEKWDEALNVWMSLYEKTNKWVRKAELSSNIALCYEMIGNFDKAVEYAEVSYNLFKENEREKENNMYINAQNYYFEVLKKRKEDDKMLSGQLGE